MIKYECDRCGRLIEDSKQVAKVIKRQAGLSPEVNDYCQGCFRDFIKWQYVPKEAIKEQRDKEETEHEVIDTLIQIIETNENTRNAFVEVAFELEKVTKRPIKIACKKGWTD